MPHRIAQLFAGWSWDLAALGALVGDALFRFFGHG